MNIHNIIQSGAIGDAFGYQVEFDSMQSIFSKYGPKGLQYKVSHQIPASDDTQMTLFLLECINEYTEDNQFYDREEFTKKAHHAFGEWYYTQTSRIVNSWGSRLINQKAMYKRQAPGGTCLSALGNPISRNLTRKINDSKGCGNVMRVAPLLVLQKHYDLSNSQLFEAAISQAAITHGNEEGLTSTGFFMVLLSMLAHHHNFQASYQEALCVSKNLRNNQFISYIESVYAHMQNPDVLEFDALVDVLGEGWTSDSAVGVAMYCSQKSSTFKQCIELASNHRGDSDSTASMAAQLFSASHPPGIFLFETDLDDIIAKMF